MVKIGNVSLGECPLLLAPMEDVSDPPFRILAKEQGADLVFTEFISAEGLIRNADKSVKKLDIYRAERPIGIQIFGENIDSMVEAAHIVQASQPEILDINYGCPVKKVACRGAGAGILRDLPKMQKMTEQIVRISKIPVTVKTRLGWDENHIQIEEVAERLQDAGIQALTIHGRTRKQMYKGIADWSYLKKIKENPRIQIPIFGNGDIDSGEKAMEYYHKYKVDGLMIGRAAIGNPWIFSEIKEFFRTGQVPLLNNYAQRVDTCQRHLKLSVEWKGEKVGINEMKRHYNNYLKGVSCAKKFRTALVQAVTFQEANQILEDLRLYLAEPLIAS